MRRRDFLLASAAAAGPFVLRGAGLPYKERVDRALAGKEVDRPPFSFWHHFGLNTAEAHAMRTLEFHRQWRTDIVKVMSDFPFPQPEGKWYQLRVIHNNPFPDQIKALELIRDGLGRSAYFIETVFNPWNVAQKLSSKEEVLRLKDENPGALLNALDIITKSEIQHAKRALGAGASGVLFSVANANRQEMTVADYEKFSLPFDKRFLEAIPEARLTVLHLHVEPPYLHLFEDFKAPVINYSVEVSGIPIADLRRRFPSSVIAGGIDEVNYRKLTAGELKKQWHAAAAAAGPQFILTPGCSVPNDSEPAELERLPKALGA